MNSFITFIKFLFDGHSAKIMGEVGELKMKRLLNKLPDSDYHAIYDIYLPSADGATTQVDALVVSKYGVFVVEAKNYDGSGDMNGLIFGDAESKQWCMCTRRGKKYRFQNPLRQNYKHIAVLSELTGISRELFHSVIVFVGWADFKTAIPDGVVYGYNLVKYITGFKKSLIKDSQVAEVVEVIREWEGTVSKEMKDSHVDNLRRRHGANAGCEMLCPRCGAPMVIRKKKSNGEAFFGCSKYPKCRAIVSLKNR